MTRFLFIFCLIGTGHGCTVGQEPSTASEVDWRLKLSDEQFHVLRQCGTEPPFSGKFWDHHEDGIYGCAGCGNSLFDSRTKFESGSGWPSFFDALDGTAIDTRTDYKLGYPRTELLCHECQGHLGHIFNDGPEPTGFRYCINSAALIFTPRDSLLRKD